MIALWDGTLSLGLYWLCSFWLLNAAVVVAVRPSPHEEPAPSLQNCTPSHVCTSSKSPTLTPVTEECGIWVALSTIPGAGLGIFAGKKFRSGETLLAGGDQIIPMVDLLSHHPEMGSFLWNDYTWNAEPLGVENLGWQDVILASPGIGSISNSLLDFVNSRETVPTYSVPHGLHRRSDPGVGAFTYYHGRLAQASSKIMAGEEIFVSYGKKWFQDRKGKLGPIPLTGDHTRADDLYRRFRYVFPMSEPEEKTTKPNRRRERKLQYWSDDDEIIEEKDNEKVQSEESIEEISLSIDELRLNEIGQDFWNTFVMDSAWHSPTLAAFPPREQYDDMHKSSLKKMTKRRSHRNVEWLQENGVCADIMHPGVSTIRQAGHGAFASRRLYRGAINFLVPLIHVPNRQVFDMYLLKTDSRESNYQRDTNHPMPPQLMLNYCMGHRDSTLLLCPFGPHFSLINHNQTLANVRLQWASPTGSPLNPSLLNMTVSDLEDVQNTQLAMELVALRDIEPGEEIFLDYGDEWELAWQQHVREWKPVEGADSYVSSLEMNERFDHIFSTESEQVENPYPSNLVIEFLTSFEDRGSRERWLRKNPIPKPMNKEISKSVTTIECKIIGRETVGSRSLYTVLVPSNDNDGDWDRLESVPQEALIFRDRPYTTDMFLPNAFRHDLRISDEIFPEAWKNLKATRDSLQ